MGLFGSNLEVNFGSKQLIQGGGQKIITWDNVDKKIIGHLTDLNKKKIMCKNTFFKFAGFGGNFVSKNTPLF